MCVFVLSHFGCVQLCDPMDCSLPGFSVRGILHGQPCLPSGDLPDSGMEPRSLKSPALAGEFFTTSITWEAPIRVTYGSLNTLCWFMFPIRKQLFLLTSTVLRLSQLRKKKKFLKSYRMYPVNVWWIKKNSWMSKYIRDWVRLFLKGRNV